ncbi:MAG: hypothetical protein ABI589_13590 [Burkholderiales bacterium]
MPKLSLVPSLEMQQRSDRADFFIRDRQSGTTTTTPHRHEYFQIQVNLASDRVQHIGGAVRPFTRNTLAFILPHRLHVIPHPADGNFVLINFKQDFSLPHLQCDPLDLEDVSLAEAAELASFRFQEHLDFVLDDADFGEVQRALACMREIDQTRDLGSGLMQRACCYR